MLAMAVGGALLAGAAAAIALTGDMPHKVFLAERQALTVATPIAVGLYAWSEGTHARFGRLLVLAGGAWFLVSLSSSSDSLLFTIGRIAGWTVEAGLVYLMLAFPSGRLTNRVDRVLAASAVAVAAILFVPTGLVTEAFPTMSQFSTCAADCPQNAFMLLDSEPAFVEASLCRCENCSPCWSCSPLFFDWRIASATPVGLCVRPSPRSCPSRYFGRSLSPRR